MHFPLLRRILVALVLLTFVGGSWLSAAAQEAPRSPCTMAMDTGMPMGGNVAKLASSDRSMPCEQGAPSCNKQLCCLAGAMLLVSEVQPVTLRHSVIHYRPTGLQLGGMSVE